MAGRAVLRMVPSRDCMKKAMATTQGSQRAVVASSGARSGMGPLGEFRFEGGFYRVRVRRLTSAPGKCIEAVWRWP